MTPVKNAMKAQHRLAQGNGCYLFDIQPRRELSSELIISSFSILPPILWAFAGYVTQQGLHYVLPLPVVCQPFGLAFQFLQAIKGITELTESRLITLCAPIRLKGISNANYELRTKTITKTKKLLCTHLNSRDYNNGNHKRHGRISYDNEKTPLHSYPLCERL